MRPQLVFAFCPSTQFWHRDRGGRRRCRQRALGEGHTESCPILQLAVNLKAFRNWKENDLEEQFREYWQQFCFAGWREFVPHPAGLRALQELFRNSEILMLQALLFLWLPLLTSTFRNLCFLVGQWLFTLIFVVLGRVVIHFGIISLAAENFPISIFFFHNFSPFSPWLG